jgi:hypothetical protein
MVAGVGEAAGHLVFARLQERGIVLSGPPAAK